MDTTLLEQGLELMLAGMGTVFAFLTTLVLATSLMSKIINRFAPAPVPDKSPTAEEVAAISAAISRYRGERR